MDISNIDLDSAPGHKILHAMDGMRVVITDVNGVRTTGILSVPAVRHPHVTLSIREDRWEPVRIERSAIELITVLPHID